jgi:hypothetical protein
MTLKCETEFPKALKNLMLSMGMQGEAVYKGFPVIDEGQEYWWVQLHDVYTRFYSCRLCWASKCRGL